SLQVGQDCPTYANAPLELVDETLRRFHDEFARQVNWLSTKSANRLHDLQQIAAVAGARVAPLAIVALVHEVDRFGARIHAEPFHHIVENTLVDVARRRLDAHLVANTPQESVVHEVLGVEVRGEDNELL